jgi:hypothetical protein
MPESPVAPAPPRWLTLRWLLVTVTGAGVIAMHTLMGTGAAHHTTSAQPMTGAVSMADAVSMTSAVDTVGAAPMTDLAPTADRAPMTAAPPTAGQDAAGHQGHHGDGSMSMLAHLCLAVLGLLLFVLAAPALLARYRRDTDRAVRTAAGHPSGYGQSRAPPPTAVRLAELCISRR